VWGRPAALAVAKDGSLLVADDTRGTIGVLPTLARATVPLQIRIGRSRNGEKRLWDAFFVHKPVSATIPQCLLSEVKQTLALSSGYLFLTQSGYGRSGLL
jgi:hypothetical protein